MLKAPNSDTVQASVAGASLAPVVYDINQFMKSNELPLLASEQPAEGDSIGQVAADHERLRYVTRLLGSPPGLNTALFGTLFFLMNADESLHWLNGWWRLLAVLAWMALLVWGWRIYLADWIPEYYKQRFGSVQAARKPGSKWSAVFFLILFFGGWPLAHYLDPFASRLHVMISDPSRQINLWPSVYWAVLLCASLRWQMSDIERQRFYFLFVGMIGFASIVCYAIWHPAVKQLGVWKILNAGGFGLSLIALGLYDYIVLVRALPKTVAEGEDE
jgi:hypothetical protein